MAVSYDQLREGEVLRPPADLPEPTLAVNARKVLERRYLHRIDNRVVETPGGGFWRVAEEVARGGASWIDAEALDARTREYYHTMATLEFLPNSPTLMNAGKRNGLQYSACYVLPVEDSMEGIFESVKRAALIHKSGGGTGFAFSRLRPSGDIVGSTGGVASGPVSFMEVFNGATESVKQGGTRRGANMGILRIDHPDVLKFIDCKRLLADGPAAAYAAVERELSPAGRDALRRHLLETQISNFNISLAVTDRFMEALGRDEEYELIHPRNGEIVSRLRARDVFDRMVHAAWETGDPGIVFIDRINAGAANPVPEMGPVEATNPCVTADTLVATAQGLQRVGDLYRAGTPVEVVVDGRLSAAATRGASAVFATGVKPVYRLRTAEGYELRLTADHRVMTARGWVAAGDLRPGDRVHLQNRKGGFGSAGSAELGQVLGWLVGDGTFASERAILSFFGAEKEELAPAFAAMVGGLVPAGAGRRGHYAITAEAVPGRDETRVRSTRLSRLAEEHGLRAGDKHKVPESVFVGSEAVQRGFLQALFTADGHVSGTLEKGVSARLTSVSRSLLVDVQRLLLNFGIASAIYTDRRAEGLRLLPDGKGGHKPYQCQAYHDLVIAKDNLARFASEIGFLTEAKQQALLGRLATYRRGPYRESFTATFAALEPDGEEAVYDLTEPTTHSFLANGIVVHNCGEQPLYPNEACNLGSINLARFVKPGGMVAHRGAPGGIAGVDAIDWERMERTVRLAIRFLDDVITVNPYPDKYIDHAVKANRRVGLGVMGWADLLIQLEIPYDSEEALRLGSEVMRRINEAAHDESCRLAEERGPFPNWVRSIYRDGRPQRNATVTTIAPTGTISIIAGCSSGIEPLFALVFDRRGSLDGQLSLETNAAFLEVAQREGFWSEDLARQVHAHGTVRGLPGVPEKWQRVFGTAHDIHPDWHVRMQAAFQAHTDNAVSKTINLPHDASEADVERAYRLAYEAGCNGITVYRDGSKEGVLHVGSGGGAAPAVADGHGMQPRPKMMAGCTYSVETPLGTAYITVNHDEQDEPREVFVNQGKAGSDIAPLSEAIGKLASIALRIPSSMPPRDRLREIVRRLRGIGGSSSLGFGAERTRSLPDALAKVLDEYLERQEAAERAAAAEKAAPASGPSANGTAAHANGTTHLANGNGNGAAQGGAQALAHAARFTGDLCPDCGTALVYEEGCSKCMGCGFARC